MSDEALDEARRRAAQSLAEAEHAVHVAAEQIAQAIVADEDAEHADKHHRQAEALDMLALAIGRGKFGPQGGRIRTDYEYRTGTLGGSTRQPAGFAAGEPGP